MNGTYVKLVGIATAVATIGGYVFNFSSFNSKDSLIKTGVDRLKAIVIDKNAALDKLQGEYDALEDERNSLIASLGDARDKLETIYEKITGEAWNEENGDILGFDFNTLVKDGDQFENNVDGNAIAEMLGLEAGATTEEIIAAIQDLQDTIATLNNEIERLEQQIEDLQAEIELYDEEQDALVEEINGLKAKLDEATAKANAIIDEANTEEQEQLDYINNTLTELGAEQVKEEVPEQGEGEVEESSVVLSGDWTRATEEDKNAILNMCNELGIQNAEVTAGFAIDSPGNYIEIKVPTEAYNVMVANEYYDEATHSLYISDSGNIVSKSTANPDGKAVVPNGYIRVRIAQQ